jgi:hypothetical protein
MGPRQEAFKEELDRLMAEWKVEDERMRERMQASTTLNDAARAEARRLDIVAELLTRYRSA